MYQQDLFGGLKEHVRGDCETRFRAIKEHVDFIGKSVLDMGCAEGYFGFSAILCGAEHVTFVDNDKECLKVVNTTALDQHFISKIQTKTEINSGKYFDVVICLDLWPHADVAHPRHFKDAEILIISPSGNGTETNPRLVKELSDYFKFVKPIHSGYQNRIIFKCEGNKCQS